MGSYPKPKEEEEEGEQEEQGEGAAISARRPRERLAKWARDQAQPGGRERLRTRPYLRPR